MPWQQGSMEGRGYPDNPRVKLVSPPAHIPARGPMVWLATNLSP